MAEHYTTKSFLTSTGIDLLQRYFQGRGLLADFPWDGEVAIEALYDAVVNCGDIEQVELDFKTIHEWANEIGIGNLIDQARSPSHGGLEIGEELGRVGDEYAQAMHVWLEYPEVFRWAIELSDWELQKGKVHYYVGQDLPCNGDDEGIREALGEAIGVYFEKEAKGRRCEVEYYPRVNPARHFFVANPEDSIKGYRAYDGKDRIVRQAYRPIFQVVFEYNPEDGDLAIHVRQRSAKEKMYEVFCTKVLGFKTPPNADTDVFDLRPLRNPEFRLVEDEAIPAEITLKMVMLRLTQGTGRRVTLEASPHKGDHRQVEAMMFRTLMALGENVASVIMEKAKIEIKFKPVNLRKIKPITFIVGSPQYSNLANDEKSEMARAYLKKWGLLTKHKMKKEAADAV